MMCNMSEKIKGRLSRRDFIFGAGGLLAGVMIDHYVVQPLLGRNYAEALNNSAGTGSREMPDSAITATNTGVPTEGPTQVPQATSLPQSGIITSVDTMKSSRDRAREGRPQEWIDAQVEAVANTGATHIAIATPYDKEFDGEMRRWVNSSREKGLNVWYRGNMSSWEGWFDRAKNPDPGLHREGINNFITRNGDLLMPQDIFTPCPEAENGIGNVWASEDNKEMWRNFLMDSYYSAGETLSREGINGVLLGYYSMNGDVATILTPEVVAQIGNTVVIDHYVSDPKAMGNHIQRLQDIYPGVNVVVGEYGAPIPDINGEMTEEQQAKFVGELMDQMLQNNVGGMNYWVLWDGSTALLNEDLTQRMAYDVVKTQYSALR